MKENILQQLLTIRLSYSLKLNLLKYKFTIESQVPPDSGQNP